jgi:hypothetical protein
MRKKLISLLILSVYSVVGITQTSEGERIVNGIRSFKGENNWYYKVENGEATITGTGYGVIPSELNGYPVRKVEALGNVKTITIPNTVTSIKKNVFISCSKLTEISVDPNSTTYSSEGGVLFDNLKTTLIACPARKEGSYIIPSSVTCIEANAFVFCTSLTSITIPNSVTSIGDKSFYSCTNLASVSIGSGATNIGANAFALCSSLTSMAIPNSVTSIGENAFEGCANLASISIGSNVTNIGRNAFGGCPTLTSVTLVDGLPEIGTSWFPNLPIINIIIPPSVKSISGNAFGFCTNLTSITIPNSVTSISSSAFSGCDKLPKETLDQIKQKEPKY